MDDAIMITLYLAFIIGVGCAVGSCYGPVVGVLAAILCVVTVR
jgi:hypothetical protein